MAEEGALKIELAKLQAEVKTLEDDITQLIRTRDRSGAVTESQKARAIEEAKSAFTARQQQDIKTVTALCADMHDRADALLDTFPGLKSKEYAGKYEVKDIEAKLVEFYPQALLDAYVCADPIEFRTEGEAYSAYAYVERKVATLRQGSFASVLFNGITSMMNTVCKSDGASGKVALGVLGLVALSFVFSPFLFLTVFSVLGVCSMVQGAMVHRLLRNLYSVKAFLNDAYDEDIFQEDKQDVLSSVDQYLEDVKESYIQEISERKFAMNPQILEDIERSARQALEKTNAAISLKQQLLNTKREEAARKLEELDEAQRRREESAKRARAEYLETIDWKREWVSQLLLDVTPDNRVQGCRWQQNNTVYYSKNLDSLQNFWQLAIYQGMLKMPPDYCGQVVIDYKYMGSNLVQFSQVVSSIFTLCTDKEAIDKKLERIRDDIKARCSNILRTCESIEEFNKLMATYDSTGESYVIVHICGLQSVSPDLRMFLKNGPKVGYFFKIYTTLDEYQNLAKDFPYEDVPEFAEVGDTVTPRTVAQLRRLAEESA